MSYVPSDPRSGGGEGEREIPVAGGGASDDPAGRLSEAGHPRLIEEHAVRGRYGADELEATDERGRRWYHLRPDPRGRADVIGFNYTWWIVMWVLLLLVVFLPWGY